jgi:hypothetical protein
MSDTVTVEEHGRTITFTLDDALRYAGPHSPAGVAMAFQALQRAFGLLSPGTPPERRAITIRTPFRGPGARDAFEAVTRAVTDGRFTVDRTLVRPDRGRLLEDFVFEIGIGAETATVLLRDGFVTDEFIDLARTDSRSAAQELRLDELKALLADRMSSVDTLELFDVES